MRFNWPTYPTRWRWRFALIPVSFGERTWLWLEPYYVRDTGPASVELKDTLGKVVSFYIV